jgi:transcriptional regulator GlxA family with amidase domain
MHSAPISARSSPDSQTCIATKTPGQFDVTRSQVTSGVDAEAVRLTRFKLTNHAKFTAANKLIVSLNYMVTHLDKPMTVSNLSSMAGLSMSQFFALFKSVTGDSPINWIIRARMQWASELLERSNLRIKEVAVQVGYGDQFYFSRLFK